MRTFSLAVIVCSFSVVAGAQAPSPSPAPALASAPGPAAGAGPAQPPAKPAPPQEEPFAYESGGRRDPFVNILGTGAEPPQVSRRGEGPTGLTVADIAVRGIVANRGTLVAMVQGPDKKTYLIHQGDKFVDGTVKSITPQGLIIVQDVKDPLGLVKQREIRKQLRSLEDAKQ
jgi:Tfp pilus assembly protein PilP